LLAYINGRIMPQSEARVSINDRGWLYGDAVFETLRTYTGRIFKLKEHLERLERSAALIGLELPLSRQGFDDALRELLGRQAARGDLMIRITVSRGAGGTGLFPASGSKPTVVIQPRELPAYSPATFSEGWSLIVAKTSRNYPGSIDPRIKSTNFLNNVLAKREAIAAGADDALMLNHRGFVAESTSSNFFAVQGSRLHTPSVDDGILPGITRGLVLALAVKAGLTVVEKSITVDAVLQCDEAFLTLTSAGIIPVVSIDGARLGEGRPGAATGRLREMYDAYIDAFARGGVIEPGEDRDGR
jgi:branched-chain amino acid aminotransferase